MALNRSKMGTRGVSLMEVTLAVAIFSGVIGVTAQSIASFYVTIDVQEQRMEAITACRGVMDALREKRAEFSDDFPEDLLTWVENQNEDGWEAFLENNAEHTELASQTLSVECVNMDGDRAGAGDNPIMVHTTTTWLDRRGRRLSATASSILTDL